MNKTKVKKIVTAVSNVFLALFLIIAILAVFLTIFSRRGDDGVADIMGYQMRIVTSESMAKCEHTDVSSYEIKDIPLRSMVFIELMPEDPAEATEWYRSLKVGDVLTFKYVYSAQVTITHRIVSIEEKETGGFIIELAGDNKNADNGQLYQTIDTTDPYDANFNCVVGKVTGQSYFIGLIMSYLMQPIGIVLVIIIPCVILIFYEAIKITRVLAADKKSREQDEKEKEIEELRRRLNELETEVTKADPADKERGDRE